MNLIMFSVREVFRKLFTHNHHHVITKASAVICVGGGDLIRFVGLSQYNLSVNRLPFFIPFF